MLKRLLLPLLAAFVVVTVPAHLVAAAFATSSYAGSKHGQRQGYYQNNLINERNNLLHNPVKGGEEKSSISSFRLDSTASNNNNDNNNQGPLPSSQPGLSERTKGLAVLFTVPFAWGTYVPVVRYLYEIQPAVPGFVFSACYYAVASLTTLSIVAIQQQQQQSVISGRQEQDDEDENVTALTSDDQSPSSSPSSSSFPILGGLELGSYLFIGNCLQVVGLKTVPSDRAGFLVQLTTVMVPVLEALFAGNLLAVPTRTWFSCLLAFLGICVMNLDGIGAVVGSSSAGVASTLSSVLTAFKTFTQGDVLILSAAVLYTLHVVRLSRYAKETTPMKLAASKATVETFLSTGLVLALMSIGGAAAGVGGGAAAGGFIPFVQETGQEISTFFTTIKSSFAAGTIPQSAIVSAVGATLWTGLVTCAYTIFAQSYGQKRVGPTDANLIYSVQPLCTSLFAFLLLGETMGPAGVVGGAFIGAAVYLVTTGGNNNTSNDDSDDSNTKYKEATMEVEVLEEQRNATEVLVRR